MRFFPGAEGALRTLRTRVSSRHLAGLLVLALASALFLVPQAVAEDEDELEEQQEQVEGQIAQAEEDLQESSKRVQRLNSRLATAEADLASAREHLAEVRGKLKQAKSKQRRIAADLQQAERTLAKANRQLEQARQEVATQRLEVRDTIIGFATSGDPRLRSLGSLLDSGSLEEVMVNQTADALVVDVQFESLHDLEAAEKALGEKKQEVKAARNQVREKKEAADAQVRRTERLVNQAASAKAQVDGLVADTAKAKRQAKRARAADRRALRQLEEREKEIRRKIIAARAAATSYSGDAGGYLTRPVNGPITSPYGYRVHPIYGYYGLHDGVDFGAACGSPLYAGADGRVVHAYYDDVYGYRLYLDIGRVNGDRLTLVYNHMPRLNASVGQSFARGDVVGYVGTSGWSTGCHLHFTVLRNGDPVDPMIYL